MSSYNDAPDTSSPPPSPKEGIPPKKKREGVKMSDAQKAQLKKHMDKVGKDMSASEKKSHRMKMMGRMRRGLSVQKAHKDIMGKK
jgi:hypothetical protein